MRIAYCLILLLYALNVTGQNALSNSRTGGYLTHIYKLTDKETERLISGKSKDIDAFLHTMVDSYRTGQRAPQDLPFGNYLRVTANENRFDYELDPRYNVNVCFINNEKDFQFFITDLYGNPVPDAGVYSPNGHKIKYNKPAHLYKGAYPRKDGYVKVIYQGVTNYFEYEYDKEENRYRYKAPFFQRVGQKFPVRQIRRLINAQRYGSYTGRRRYHSVFVFSKPRYKPGETVKFKSYVFTKKGVSTKVKTVNVILSGPEGSKDLGRITAYRDGGFEYQFTLADSLKLTLDKRYSVQLVDSARRNAVVLASQSFVYEDYELKSLSFAMRTDKETHYPGDPISVFMKATDENDLVVPDARVEIIALTKSVNRFVNDAVFIPDTLWIKNMNLDPVGETKLQVPDSIFPKASLAFALDVKMFNSNNESRTESKILNYEAPCKAGVITSRFVKDSLYLDYKESGISLRQTGWLYKNAASFEVIDSQRVALPLAVKVDYRATDYDIMLDNKVENNIAFGDFDAGIRPAAVHDKERLQLSVINEHKIPFWYTVFSGNKVFLKGYTTALDTVINHTSKKAAHFRINYIWDEEEKTEEVSSAYYSKALNIKFLAPNVVQPGQKLDMKVLVTDKEERPVPNADVTAYAQTSKFKDQDPAVPYFGKGYKVRKNRRYRFESDEAYTRGNFKINWDRWGRQLGLDTIEFYKFKHPQPLYKITEPATDSITQFAPFVMKDGDFEPVNIIYVDDVPVFFDQAQQLQHYSFPITPGKHTIGLRTPDYNVWMKEVAFEKGRKTIFSVLADTANATARITRVKNKLSAQESERLNNYMIRVKNTFMGERTTIEHDSLKWFLTVPGDDRRTQQELLVGPIQQTALAFRSEGLFLPFLKEPGYTYSFSPGLIKQRSFRARYAFDTLMTSKNTLNRNFRHELVTSNTVNQMWEDYLNLRSHTTQLFNRQIEYDTLSGELRYSMDTAFTNPLPYIKNIFITSPERPHVLLIFSGNTQNLPRLPAGIYNLMFLLKDNRYFKADGIAVKANGINYYNGTRFEVHPEDSFSKRLDDFVKGVPFRQNGLNTISSPETIARDFNAAHYDYSQLKNEMTGRVVSDKGEPIAGAAVTVIGLNGGTVTDKEGWFHIKTPVRGKVMISMAGYNTVTRNAVTGDAGPIIMTEMKMQLDEVVVVGYGTQRKSALTGSVTTIQSNLSVALEGRLAGVMITEDGNIRIRGASSLRANAKPLVIVDGIPFEGDISALNPNDIESVEVLKEAAAASIYGARAKDGVIIIRTDKTKTVTNETGELQQASQTLRTNFSDEGFWQPKLITDRNGIAAFTVVFADDITSWKTRVIALGNKKQTGFYQTTIRSFKTLSANFVAPLFAVEGDSMTVMGKLMNYTPTPEKLMRILKYNDRELRNDSITVTHAHIDSVMVAVSGTDSLSFEYTLQRPDGYFDGELRKLPVYAAGVKETVGGFFYMDKDSVVNYTFEKDKGPGTIRAEASVFPVLLDEMRKLRHYEYLCNEQLASKLKSLLLEKKLRGYLKEPFGYEKHIPALIKKLNENKSMQSLWGWWQGSHEEVWISLHVVEALLQAEAQGYKISLNKNILYKYLLEKATDAGPQADMKMVQLLHVLDGRHNIKDWVQLKEADPAYRRQKKTYTSGCKCSSSGKWRECRSISIPC